MRFLLVVFLSVITLTAFSQDDKWQWWNDIHHWQPGMPGWRNMIVYSPGYLGPNALPVPEMKKGMIPAAGEMEVSLTRHFNPEDPTQDISARLLFPFYESRIAFEAYGVVLENYNYTEKIRDERCSRDKDCKGIVPGDFYFSTLIQLCKDRGFPNTVFRFACKTASGDAFAARYTDTPGYFFDFSLSKDYAVFSRRATLKPYAMFGFYSWQTYNEATPQNDALLYGAGAEFKNSYWTFSGSISGYSGYLKDHDRPHVLTFDTRYDWLATAAKIEFLYGLRDWNYQSFRFSFIWKFNMLY